MKSERASWGDFPPVIRNGDLNSLSLHPEYKPAKAGDPVAAFTLAEKVITDEFIEGIRQSLGGRKPVIVPVLAEESEGANMIPLMLAKQIGNRLGLEVELNIVQVVRAHRTNAGSDHRLVFNPVFDGEVKEGQDYLVVDDTLTMGGTIASLRGYINNRGGNVCLAAVGTAHPGALDIKIKPGMICAIENKHGSAMNELWLEKFGYGIDGLTQGEAGHLKAALSVDAMRDRLAAAEDAGRRPKGRPDLSGAPER